MASTEWEFDPVGVDLDHLHQYGFSAFWAERDPCLKIYPNPIAETIYLEKNSCKKYTDEKKKRPHYTEWIILLAFLNMRQKL